MGVRARLWSMNARRALPQARQTFSSEEGDAFTLLNVYDSWVKVKAARESGKKWCARSARPPAPCARISFSARVPARRHGVEEQRLYEMTRLKDQFADLLKQASPLAPRVRRPRVVVVTGADGPSFASLQRRGAWLSGARGWSWAGWAVGGRHARPGAEQGGSEQPRPLVEAEAAAAAAEGAGQGPRRFANRLVLSLLLPFNMMVTSP
jgi:hypothetical protein